MNLSPDFQTFEEAYVAKRPQLVWTLLAADLETPVSTMIKLATDTTNSFLLESVQGGSHRGRYSAIGLNPDLVWRCVGNKAEINRNALNAPNTFDLCAETGIESLRSLIIECRIHIPDGLPPMAAGLFGYMGYDMVRQMESLPNSNSDQLDVPDAMYLRPTVMAVFDTIEDSIFVISPVWPGTENAENAYNRAQQRLQEIVVRLERELPTDHEIRHLDATDRGTPLQPESNTTREEYHAIVEKAKEYIRAGDILQVVPSQRFSVPFELSSFLLYRALRRLNPSPFLFFFQFEGFSVVGSSPEILVRLRKDVVTIRPIAGTRPRGKNAVEDKTLAEDLLGDPKELAEHLMLLDLGRNDVGRVTKMGTVHVTEQMVIEYYSHVMHIVSNVEGEIDPAYDVIDALIAGFPAGTVTGAPKVRAMEIIDELEQARRGIYGGTVGYFSCDGDMDTCIALRTAVVKDGIMHVQAGGGVVADSDPEAEYQETCSKARALIRAAEEAVHLTPHKG